jgi:DNA helicase-2/ATP-dependent DNA helicase PcrA
MSEAQREVVGHDNGAVLVIAGPGSGKTFSLVLRTINLLLLEKAQPSQIIVCTFTEKAAYELRDRIAAASRRVGYNRDLSELNVGTIHGVCNGLLQVHRHRTPLGNLCLQHQRNCSGLSRFAQNSEAFIVELVRTFVQYLGHDGRHAD